MTRLLPGGHIGGPQIFAALYRENLLNNSTDLVAFFNTLSSGVTVDDNATAAPDGTTTALRIIEPNGTGPSDGVLRANIAATPLSLGAPYCFSIHAKRNGRDLRWFAGSVALGSAAFADYDLTGAGAVAQDDEYGTGYTFISSGITALPNSWYRCWLVMSVSADTLPSMAAWVREFGVLDTDHTGDGASGIYIWGPQVEAGTVPTSYLPKS